MRFLGITREPVFSPGKFLEADRAVLELVAAELRGRGHAVDVVAADDPWPEPIDDTVVFTMCQGPAALARLARWHDRGVRIVNTPEGILNCQRHRTVERFAHSGLPFPDTVLVDTGTTAPAPAWVGDGAWIKRGDVHATDADDVVRVDDAAGVRAALQRFHARGIARAVIQRHLEGIVLKFYAVRGRFFFCVPPEDTPPPPPAVLTAIDALGRQGAERLGVEVYGGDCVWGRNDRLSLIDLNDWPSYRACRSSAAQHIAAYLIDLGERTPT